jgi:hypothetical protein
MRKLVLTTIFLAAYFVGGVFAQDKWQESRTRHFVIYYKQVPGDFISGVGQAAERYYEEISRELGFVRYQERALKERTKIYIYDDKDDYVNNGRQKDWSHGVTFSSQKEIRTFPSAHGFFDSTLPHELGHIIFREFIGSNITIPTWFEEGVAMYQEKGKRWGAHKMVQKAIEEKKFLSLMELFDVQLYNHTQREFVELFYAESASIVYYMMAELGQHRFVNFCRRLRAGESFVKALPIAYGRFQNILDLNRNWITYVQTQ